MNIQIFGASKCFDTKKAERYFKERRIKYQYIDLFRYGISPGELNSVIAAVGIDNIINPKDQDYELYMRLAKREDKIARLLEYPDMIKTPIVRNGKNATVGYEPDVWEKWE